MAKDYNFKIHTNIMRALKRSNEVIPDSKFTTLDGIILCMVKSFADANIPCFISINEISNITLSSKSSVQRSIKRLCSANLLQRKAELQDDGSTKYYLIYNAKEVNLLLYLA